MGWLTDEARSLPPPPVINKISAYCGLMGYLTALVHNGLCRIPVFRAGVHRQLLFTTVGVYIGYFLAKNDNYQNAKRDHEMLEYIKRHPEEFKQPEKRTMAEVLENWIPIR